MSWEQLECGEKEKYHGKKSAKRAMMTMDKYHRGRDLHVYQCDYCHYWHIGNKPKWGSK